LTALASRMTHKTFLNLAPHSLSETTRTRKVRACQDGWGVSLFHRTVAPSVTVIQLSKPARGSFGFPSASGSEEIIPTVHQDLKENIQPLKLSTVAVFFLLSTVLSLNTLGGIRGDFLLSFPVCFTLSLLTTLSPTSET